MTSRMMRNVRTALSALVCGAALSGCQHSSTAAPSLLGSLFKGSVHGGQQPISGATLQLYAAGSTGYGSCYSAMGNGCTPLLGSTVVTTDTSGNFDITGDYTCPTASTQVYLVAVGGNPGLQGTAVNKNIALMAALGPCGQLSSATFIALNELTTVASVWPFAGFATGISHIGSSAGNTQGLTNAFATVNKLVDIRNGSLPGPALPVGASLPLQKLNTLADILAACINSTGGVAGDGTPCGTLFADTTVAGIAPTETFMAALNLAQHPNLQTVSLTSLITPTAPFQPVLPVAPNDFSIVIRYTGIGLSSPTGLAIDALGNVWVPNSKSSSVSKLDNTGAVLSGAGFTAGSLNLPAAIAIDASGNAWIANSGNDTVSMLSPNGATGTVYRGGGISAPDSVAVDAAGDVWIANFGNSSVTEIATSGSLINYKGSGTSAPAAIAIDPK